MIPPVSFLKNVSPIWRLFEHRSIKLIKKQIQSSDKKGDQFHVNRIAVLCGASRLGTNTFGERH